MRIGIDLGGTKIEAIALDPGGKALRQERRATPAGHYRETVEAVARLVEDIERDLGRKGSVGVGMPGALSPATGRVKNANSTCLIGQPFDIDLERRLGRPVRLANDADCFTLSEASDGAGAGAATVFGVILGTGVGGGIAVDGALVRGPNAIAGEWGHNPLPWPSESERPGRACYCGKTGCIETFLSGPGLAADYAAATGRTAHPAQLAAMAHSGSKDAEETLARYEDRLARALSSVINVLDPHVIVLGGGVGNIGRLYANLPGILPRYVFSDSVETRILPPVHGDSSGVRGAAWLWPEAEI